MPSERHLMEDPLKFIQRCVGNGGFIGAIMSACAYRNDALPVTRYSMPLLIMRSSSLIRMTSTCPVTLCTRRLAIWYFVFCSR